MKQLVTNALNSLKGWIAGMTSDPVPAGSHRIIGRSPWLPLFGALATPAIFFLLGFAWWPFFLMAAGALVLGIFIWTAQLRQIDHKEVALLLRMGEFVGFLKPGWVWPWPWIEEIPETHVVHLAGEAWDPIQLTGVLSLDGLSFKINFVLTFDIEDVRTDVVWNEQGPYIWVYSFQSASEMREGIQRRVDAVIRDYAARSKFEAIVDKDGNFRKDGINTSQRILRLLLGVEVAVFLREMASISSPDPDLEEEIRDLGRKIDPKRSADVKKIETWIMGMRDLVRIRVKSIDISNMDLESDLKTLLQKKKVAEIQAQVDITEAKGKAKARTTMADAEKYKRIAEAEGDQAAIKAMQKDTGLLPAECALLYRELAYTRASEEMAKNLHDGILIPPIEKLELQRHSGGGSGKNSKPESGVSKGGRK